MKVYLNSITGIDDAIVSMYMSKRSWTREKELDIRNTVARCTDRYGFPHVTQDVVIYNNFTKDFDTLLKWGTKHFTMLRFIDFSVTVEGLHRAGQDDWDSHSQRFNNRIIRSSTRLATFSNGEMSDWYKDKILPTDAALSILGLKVPEKIEYDGNTYVKSVNGYILEQYKNDKDVKRGLYMLSIPSNFIFKVNFTELAHCIKERDINGNANPEVKLFVEDLLTQITNAYYKINRELFYAIPN
jgi:hypothetical protein